MSNKNYQTTTGHADTRAGSPKNTTRKKNATRKEPAVTSDELVETEPLALPESVQVAMADLAGAVREGLLAFAVGTGMQVLQTLMDEDVTALAGPKGRWNPNRTAKRHGSEDGEVTLGGRQVQNPPPTG